MRIDRLLPLLALGLLAGCSSRAPSNFNASSTRPSTIVVLDENGDRERFARRARAMLQQGRYEAIERFADSLLATGVSWASGAPKFVSFAGRGFDEVDDPDQPQQWVDHLDRLRAWVEARPSSPWASIALAEGLVGRAWTARGTGWASDVSRDQFRRMFEDLEEAEGILSQCPGEARANPLWYETRLRVEHGLGEERDSVYRELLAEALKRFPLHHRFYVNAAIHLMPRWYGKEGELADFTYTATRALPDSLADEYYARVMVNQCNYSANPYSENAGANSIRTRHGLELWQRHWPSSTQPTSALAMLGYLSGNRGLARHAFRALGDTLELEIWRSRGNYDTCREWALAEPVAAK